MSSLVVASFASWMLATMSLIGIFLYLAGKSPRNSTIEHLSFIPIFFFIIATIFAAEYILLALILFWDAINAIRLYAYRYKRSDLIRKVAITWFELALVKLIVLVGMGFGFLYAITPQTSMRLVGITAFVVNIVFATTVILRLIASRPRHTKDIQVKKLPTVTLAIPARNETHALEACLDRALVSTYPKLEILVLDDCSQDDTSDIILSYAHAGVRFVQGKHPVEGWIGKNYAYKWLTEEASGEYIIFSDVDIHLGPNSIAHIIEYMLETDKNVVSVLPQRRKTDFAPNFFQSLGYFWQLALPFELIGKKPFSSACWAIKKEYLQARGGFEKVFNLIAPGAYFAKMAARQGGYKFLVSDHTLEITTRKRVKSQLATAIRTLYPALGRNITHVFSVVIILLVALEFPFIYIVASALRAQTVDLILLLVAWLLTLVTFVTVAIRINHPNWYLAIFNMPVAVAIEIFVLIWSMLMYEFGTIYWKGRNVCLPALKINKKNKSVA